MRIDRLAQLLEHKYNLGVVTAGTKEDEQKINDVRQEVLDAFNNYFNPKTVKPAYNIIPLLAEQGEKYSRQITALMEDLVNDVDSLDLYNLFQGIQNILAVVSNLQEGERKALRDSIDNAFPLQRETDRNRRTMAKSKFENVVFKKLASILEKLSKRLNIMLGKSMSMVGGPTEPEVKEPTKQEQFMFRTCPLAVKHGLDNPETFAKIWLMPELRRKLIRVMNRGKNRWASLHTDPEIVAEVEAIMAEYKRNQTNEGYFEAGEDAAKEMARPKWVTVTPEMKKEREEQQRTAPTPLTDAEFVKKHQEMALQQRLQDAKKYQEQTNPLKIQEQKQKEIEEDRERHIRSEGKMDVLIARFAKRYL